MRLTVLGCSAAYPVPGNPASGYLVETGGGRLWLDAGTGTFAAHQELARRAGRHWADLDGIVISHAHADHCLDLVPLYYALRFLDEGPPRGRLPLFWPEGCRAALGPLIGEGAREGDKLGRVFDIHRLDPEREIALAGARISSMSTDHAPPTVALAIEAGGRRLVYTADTGPAVDLAPFARGADLLLAEATYQAARTGPPIHLTAAQAGDLARRAGVGRLVVTHVWPTLDPAESLREATAAAGEVPVELASPERVFSV